MKKIIISDNKSNLLINGLLKELMQKHHFVNGYIKGEEILKFARRAQINKFIMFQIYQDWSSQTKRIRHPFFDYEHAEVKQQLKGLQNVLSRHIKIKEDDFRPIVEKAIYNTVKLILNPLDAVSKFFFGGADSIPTEVFKRHASYFADFDFVMQSLVKYYDGNAIAMVEKQDLFKKFEKVIEIFENKEGKSVKKYQKFLFKETFGKSLSDILALREEYPKERVEEPRAFMPAPKLEPVVEVMPEPREEKPEIVTPVEPITRVEETEIVISEQVSPPVEIDNLSGIEKAQEENEIRDETPIDLFAKKTEVSDLPAAEEKRTIADTLKSSSKPSTLVDSFSSESGGMPEQIPVHKQFEFVQKLFSGSSVKYRVILDKLDQVTNFNAALGIMEKYVFNDPQVSSSSPAAKDFVAILKRKFNS